MGEITALDERVSEDRFGFFTVLFSNSEGYDMDEITQTFSEFGQVLGVRRAGDDWGIHFVTFGSYEEAKCAVDGLEDNPDIRLKVHFKNKPQQPQQQQQYQQRRRYDGGGYYENNDYYRRGANAGYDAQRRWRAMSNGYYNNNSAAREVYVENGGYDRRRYVNDWADDNAGGEHRWRAAENDNCREETSSVEVQSDDDAVGDEAKDERVEEEKPSPQYNAVESYLARMEQQQQQQPEVSSETVAAAIEAEDEQLVATASQEVVKAEDEETLSSTSSSSSEEEPEPVIETACELIVGNVDARYNEAFVLHLFNEHEPIAVSRLAPVTPRSEVRFCSVYFKSDEVARRVERTYDGLSLAGRQIVAQRPSRLIAAYLQQI